MTLRQLVFFGRTLGKDRDKILKSANYVRQELPIRIAHRIRDLQALPYVVMTNKHLEDVYNKYWSAFEKLRRFPLVKNMEDNERFCHQLKGLLEDHLTIIPSLTIGIVESSHHLPAQQLDGFMERMLRSRISRRVLAEQHIALSEALDDPFHFFNDESMPPALSSADSALLGDEASEVDMGDHIGIIYTHLSIAAVVRKGIRLLRKMFAAEQGIAESDPFIPEVAVDGDLGARFAYIPEHLEYIVFELLKNAMRAVMRREMKDRDPTSVRVTIVEGPEEEDIIIRVSDSGGGLPDVASHLGVGGPSLHSVLSRDLAPQMGALPNTLTSTSATSAGAYGVNISEALPALDGSEQATSRSGPSALSNFLGDQAVESMAMRPRAASSQSAEHALGDDGVPARRSSRVPFISSSTDQNANEALITFLCSFSNVRRRLELEADRQQSGIAKKSTAVPPVATGLGTSQQLHALKTMGTFKGELCGVRRARPVY